MNSDYQMQQAAEPLDGAMHADCDGGGLIPDIPAAFTHGMPPDTGAQAGTDGFQASTSIAADGIGPYQADTLQPEETSQASTAIVFDRLISTCSCASDTTVESIPVYRALAQIADGAYAEPEGMPIAGTALDETARPEHYYTGSSVTVTPETRKKDTKALKNLPVAVQGDHGDDKLLWAMKGGPAGTGSQRSRRSSRENRRW